MTKSELRILAALSRVATVEGYSDLSAAAALPLRSAERGVAALRRAGLVSIKRLGDGQPSIIALTAAGRRAAYDGSVKAAAGEEEASVPFAGEKDALETSRAVLAAQRDRSPEALARAYLDRVSTRERVRISALLDAHGVLPADVIATADLELDEGLRAHFARDAIRARNRAQLRDALKHRQ